MLHTYVKEQQALAPCTVSATYLLAGLMKDGSHVVCIVSDGTYNEEHSKFDVITSEHVYSIHKGQATCMQNNFQILYTADVGLDPPIGLVLYYWMFSFFFKLVMHYFYFKFQLSNKM